MNKILSWVLGFIISLSLATVTYAMVFNISFTDDGTKQIVTIESWKSIVFSLSKKIDSINFNKDSGFTIRTLEGWKWIDMTDNVSDYTPMKGYMIRNISEWNLIITMNLKNIIDINDTIFQKTLKAGWNLVWPAYKNDKSGLVENIDAFGNSNYSHIADFTGNGFYFSGEVIIIDWKVKENNLDIRNKNELANVQFVEWLAYAVFVSNDTVIPGSQKLTSEQIISWETNISNESTISWEVNISWESNVNQCDYISQSMWLCTCGDIQNALWICDEQIISWETNISNESTISWEVNISWESNISLTWSTE